MIELKNQDYQIDEYEMILALHQMLCGEVVLKSTQQAYEEIKDRIMELKNDTQ